MNYLAYAPPQAGHSGASPEMKQDALSSSKIAPTADAIVDPEDAADVPAVLFSIILAPQGTVSLVNIFYFIVVLGIALEATQSGGGDAKSNHKAEPLQPWPDQQFYMEVCCLS